METDNLSEAGGKASQSRMRDLEAIDAELRLVALLRRAARERGGTMPSIAEADALLDERRWLTAS
jgi:hypothetical protein